MNILRALWGQGVVSDDRLILRFSDYITIRISPSTSQTPKPAIHEKPTQLPTLSLNLLELEDEELSCSPPPAGEYTASKPNDSIPICQMLILTS